jgi:hypothetical protein
LWEEWSIGAVELGILYDSKAFEHNGINPTNLVNSAYFRIYSLLLISHARSFF